MVDIVENGIVSANELIGGLWVLLLSLSALRTGKLSKGLNYLGILIGIAGILTMIRPIAEATQTFFGLSMIVWFAWLGIVLWRNRLSTATESQNAFTPHHSATD